jgi:hypothetical protein
VTGGVVAMRVEDYDRPGDQITLDEVERIMIERIITDSAGQDSREKKGARSNTLTLWQAR